MIQFLYHDGIRKETAALKRRFRNLEASFSTFERLCERQFHPLNPQPVIGPGKLHRVTQNDTWTLWKIELIVPGLRPNQWPRVWFATKGDLVAFLHITSHIDNYDDRKSTDIALARVSDFF